MSRGAGASDEHGRRVGRGCHVWGHELRRIGNGHRRSTMRDEDLGGRCQWHRAEVGCFAELDEAVGELEEADGELEGVVGELLEEG